MMRVGRLSRRLFGSQGARRFASSHTLVLMRHGQSEWNLQNRFTGWVDVKLTEQGKAEARQAGQLMKEEGLEFDEAFTSVLSRAIMTCNTALEEMGQLWIPVRKDWHLNERHYGSLAGLDKAETAAKHGADQVKIWRRSYDIPPPELDESHPHFSGNDPRYAQLAPGDIPRSESLKDTVKRVIPWWEDNVEQHIRSGKRLLIAAHGNSLRALVKHLDAISDEDITELNIPTGVPLVYELGPDMLPLRRNGEPKGTLSGRYLGDQAEIEKAAAAVAAQAAGGKA